MRLIIAGGRDFNNFELLKNKMNALLKNKKPEIIISGGAIGADRLGEKYAGENGIEINRFIPDWNGLGKKAGHVRNYDMALFGTHLVAFWDGKSRGTKNMIETMRKMNKPVRVVNYEK